VVEAIQDESVICTDEAPILLAEQPICQDFTLQAVLDGPLATVSWSAYPGAVQYWVYVLDGDGMMLPGFPILLPPDQLSIVLDLETGVSPFSVGVSPWIPPDGAICLEGLTLGDQQQQHQGPCAIMTDRGDVAARVGPGPLRSVFSFLSPGVEYRVTGMAHAEDDSLWWQIDKTQIPGHEAVTSLWVAASDVTTLGICTQVPEVEIPPVVPDGEEPGEPGGWGPCGSCDTCGHPSECVTSPEGLCLWDPATCGGVPPGEVVPGCYNIAVTVDMARCSFTTASAMLDTAPNCEGSAYSPGTAISAHAVAVDPKCFVDYWSGCGASGSSGSVSFTATSSCTLIAHMRS